MPNNNNKLQYLPTDIFTKYFEAYKICKDFWNSKICGKLIKIALQSSYSLSIYNIG